MPWIDYNYFNITEHFTLLNKTILDFAKPLDSHFKTHLLLFKYYYYFKTEAKVKDTKSTLSLRMWPSTVRSRSAISSDTLDSSSSRRQRSSKTYLQFAKWGYWTSPRTLLPSLEPLSSTCVSASAPTRHCVRVLSPLPVFTSNSLL